MQWRGAADRPPHARAPPASPVAGRRACGGGRRRQLLSFRGGLWRLQQLCPRWRAAHFTSWRCADGADGTGGWGPPHRSWSHHARHRRRRGCWSAVIINALPRSQVLSQYHATPVTRGCFLRTRHRGRYRHWQPRRGSQRGDSGRRGFVQIPLCKATHVRSWPQVASAHQTARGPGESCSHIASSSQLRSTHFIVKGVVWAHIGAAS